MNTIINIQTGHGGLYFSLFYFLSVAFCVIFLTIKGYRLKYPMIPWLLIIFSGLIWLVVGTKIFSYSWTDLHGLVTEFSLPNNGKKTILGGLAGLITGVFIAKGILKFRLPALDMVAVALPVSMAIQKAGCLMMGCCCGKPCHLPWAISYSATAHGTWVDHGNISSITIHPTQVYAILAYLLIASIIWKFGHRIKSSGNKFLTAISMILLWRFFEEFLRDPKAGFFTPQYYFGISQIQWFIAFAFLIFFTIVLVREKSAVPPLDQKSISLISRRRILLLYLALILIWLLTFTWFTPLERILVMSLAIPITLLMIRWSFRQITLPEFRLITVIMIFLGAIFCSQSIEPKIDITDKDQKITWASFRLGGMDGKFSNTATYYYNSSGCNRRSEDFSYEHNFQNAALGFSQVWKNGKYFYQTFSINGYLVEDKITCISRPDKNTMTYLAINPSYKADFEFWGLGAGFHMGDFRYAMVKQKEMEFTEIKEGGCKKFTIYPDLSFRIGYKKYLYFEWRFADFFPSSSPMPRRLMGFGSGLGRLEKNNIGIGYADKGYYFSGTFALSRKWLLEAFYMDNFKQGFDQKRGFAISTQFRFGFKELK